MKARLQTLHNRKKVDPKDQNNGPTLRKKPGAGTGSADDPAGSTQSDDDRPTLKRRPQDTN